MRRTKHGFVMPHIWQEISARGDTDLVTYIQSFIDWINTTDTLSDDMRTRLCDFVAKLGASYTRMFSQTWYLKQHHAREDVPRLDITTAGLQTLDELADFYGHRVPELIWHPLAYVITYAKPNRKFVLSRHSKNLYYPYDISSAALAAVEKTSKFSKHIDSILLSRTGQHFVHSCERGYELEYLQTKNTEILFEPDEVTETTMHLLSHICEEAILKVAHKFPFELPVSAQEKKEEIYAQL